MTNQGKSLNIRELSLDAIIAILEDHQFSHLIIRQVLEKYAYLTEQERHFFSRLTQGTTEHMILLDYIINQYSKTPVQKMKPLIRNLLRMTAYQIYFMDSVPGSAACNEAVKLAVKRGFSGLKGFVNGVSRSIVRGKETFSLPNDWSIKYSMPGWIIDCYRQLAGTDKTLESLEYLASGKETEITVHCHTSKASSSDILQSLEGEGAKVRPDSDFEDVLHLTLHQPITAYTAFQEGLIQVQNMSSILACKAADAKPGDFCIDVCAAPGGKSIFLADAMNNSGMVISRDLTEAKCRLIEENRSRTGFSCIVPQTFDASVFDPSLAEKADLVIADLPCSGLGVLKEKPDIKYHQTPEAVQSLISLQRKILSAVSAYVKPGGTLLFSTCTVNAQENEENIRWFLEEYPSFYPDSLSGILPASILSLSEKSGQLQLYPGKDYDGFYFARLKKH